MKIEQRKWTKTQGWIPSTTGTSVPNPQLVLVFGAAPLLEDAGVVGTIRQTFPDACLFGCSTAGEICGTQVSDDALVATAVHLEHTHVRSTHVALSRAANTHQAGERLAASLPHSIEPVAGDAAVPLTHVLVFSDGLKVNGTDLVCGLAKYLPEGVTVTGGLAGDGMCFQDTQVFRDNKPASGTVAALGFYGNRLKVGFGSVAGWDSFGPERLVTRSKGNVLFELDGRPALALYKQYLGEQAKGLPSAAFYFPLSVRLQTEETAVIRTILAVDEADQSMTFAGDIPEGAYARLMKVNTNRLIDGAAAAAQRSHDANGAAAPELAILISCCGRKYVLKQRTEEEVEAVREIFGSSTVLAGFYSYGEIAPFGSGAKCELHNQTMTITTLSEQ